MKSISGNQLLLRELGKLCPQLICFLVFSLLASCNHPAESSENTSQRATEYTNELPVRQEADAADSLPKTVSQPQTEGKEAKASSLKEKKNVLDYFHELPAPYALPYTITQKDRLWLSRHEPSGKEQQAYVDLKNGYMELSHLKSDTESESIQAALFRMEGGAPVIAICQTEARQSLVSQNYFFLRPEHEEQLDWTEYTVPVITPYEFFKEEDLPESEYLEDAFPVLLKLPQHGTDLLVQLYLGRKFYYCSDEASEAEEQVCPLYERIERRSFTMKWNRATGRFE